VPIDAAVIQALLADATLSRLLWATITGAPACAEVNMRASFGVCRWSTNTVRKQAQNVYRRKRSPCGMVRASGPCWPLSTTPGS